MGKRTEKSASGRYFTEGELRKLAGSRSFERGLGYVDAVGALKVGEGSIAATVRGSAPYKVVLRRGADGRLVGACDCPYGAEGNFCKHCVAVGLTVLAREDAAEAADRGKRLDAWLEAMSREELLALVRQQATEDEALRRRLELLSPAIAADAAAVRRELRGVLDPSPFMRYGYMEYSDVYAYARQADEAVALLRGLCAAGQAADAVMFIREAISHIEALYEEADDSSGALGELVANLLDLHLSACHAAAPDPADTAQWLSDYLLGDYAADIAISDYNRVLGQAGMTALQELAEEALSRNPRGWAEKALMEEVLKAAGRIDRLIARYAADLAPTGWTHLRIAEELTVHGRDEEALAWAERGLREVTPPHTPDVRLVDWLCDQYERRHRAPEALAVRRTHHAQAPTLASYRALRNASRLQGTWASDRPAALAALRSLPHPQGFRTLMDALLDDQAVDEAWRALPETGADAAQKLRLADLSASTRPGDALTLYRDLIDACRTRTGNHVYEEVARLLGKAKACHVHLGTENEFATYLTEFRSTQRRKRNLLAILDQHGLDELNAADPNG